MNVVYSPGCHSTDVNWLGSKRAISRTYRTKHHMMHDPSAEADIHCVESLLTLMQLTAPRCSLSEASMARWDEVTFHILTLPSAPPGVMNKKEVEEEILRWKVDRVGRSVIV